MLYFPLETFPLAHTIFDSDTLYALEVTGHCFHLTSVYLYLYLSINLYL